MTYKNIFVTGASGFIGANLVKELATERYIISVLLRKNSSHPFLKGLPLRQLEGDLFAHAILNRAITESDAIIHCAASVSFDEKDRREIYHTNVTGTENILKYALKYKKRLVFVSTASVFGTPTKKMRIFDEHEPFIFKNSSYSHSKYLAEQLVLQYVKKGLDAVIVNPSTVYGAGDLKGTGPSLYRLLTENPIFFAPLGGCSVIAVQDVVSGIIAALHKGKIGERYILTAQNIRYNELFKIVLRESKGSSSPLMTLPFFIESLGLFFLKKLPIQSKIITPSVWSSLFQFRYLSNEKAQRELRWKPTAPIEQALQEGYQFYLQQKQ